MIKRLAILACGLGLLASPAMAQVDLGSGFSVTGTATATTDYVFRNISQTRSRPAIQGAVEVSHESGVYIATFASNVAFPGTNARQEIDFAGGWRFSTAGLTIDIGGTWYTYPGYDSQEGQFGLSYAEAILKLKYEAEPVTFLGTAAYSPDFFGSSGEGIYLEGGLDVKVPGIDVTLSGRLGYQWIERNARFGAPDYLAYSVSVSRPIAHGVAISAGWYGTDISQAECGGLKICDGRFIAALSWTF